MGWPAGRSRRRDRAQWPSRAQVAQYRERQLRRLGGAELLEATPEIAASTGSACHEGQVHLSPVLAAMGVPPELGRGAVRLSVGRFTTEADIERACTALVAVARAGAAPARLPA